MSGDVNEAGVPRWVAWAAVIAAALAVLATFLLFRYGGPDRNPFSAAVGSTTPSESPPGPEPAPETGTAALPPLNVTLQPGVYPGRCTRTIDGDTAEFTIYRLRTRQRTLEWDISGRTRGVQTPEEGDPGFAEAAEFSDDWLAGPAPDDGVGCGPGWDRPLLVEVTGERTWDREVVNVTRVGDGADWAAALAAAGHAVPCRTDGRACE